MKKLMNNVSVEIKDDEIIITQSNPTDDDANIFLHPEQIELVCQWLHDAKAICDDRVIRGEH